jgi:hypothetical protein
MKISVRQVFGIDSDLEVPAYSEPAGHVPDLDPDYLFDRETTLAILAGFRSNRRVMVTGYHGTGKSTHIEQVAARLNWPCVRVNLDSHISRIDLDRQGRDRSEATASRSPSSATASCPGPAVEHRAGLRRVRRRPAGRDVRHPARARMPAG